MEAEAHPLPRHAGRQLHYIPENMMGTAPWSYLDRAAYNLQQAREVLEGAQEQWVAEDFQESLEVGRLRIILASQWLAHLGFDERPLVNLARQVQDFQIHPRNSPDLGAALGQAVEYVETVEKGILEELSAWPSGATY